MGIGGAPAAFTFVAINILFFFGVMVTGGASTQNLINWGAKVGCYIAEGEYWRLVVPMFLHVSFLHLLMNLFAIVIFGSMVERTFGTMNFVGIYLAAGLMGNVASFVAGPATGVGASGAVFGIIGAFGIYLLLNRRLLGWVGSQQLTSIAVIVVINIIFGLLATGIDNAAHFGGLIAGGLVAYCSGPRERLIESPSPLNFEGQPHMSLQTCRQPNSRLVTGLVLIAVIATALTFFETKNYLANLPCYRFLG